MKQATEKRVIEALKQLSNTLQRNFEDTGAVLTEFENSHNEWECDQSRHYAALVAGHFGMEETMKKINKLLNK